MASSLVPLSCGAASLAHLDVAAGKDKFVCPAAGRFSASFLKTSPAPHSASSRVPSIVRNGKSSSSQILASVSAVCADNSTEQTVIQKGDTWSVHKFGGTCVGTSKRIQNVAQIILNDASERKLVVVSAMSKVTDMMYDLINKAQAGDDTYSSALNDVFEKHRQAANDVLDGDALNIFVQKLHDDVNNLRAMLHAIKIAGHANESFTDFVWVMESYGLHRFCQQW